MPGLCGVASRQMHLDAARSTLKRMQELLQHREDALVSDVTEFTTDPGTMAVGAVFPNPDSGFAAELSETSTLYVYGEAYGEDAPLTTQQFAQVFSHFESAQGDTRRLTQLDGFYTAALVDKQRGILHLFTDPLGLKPLYVRETAGALWFSGELKGLLAIGALEIDTMAASEFLRFGHFLGDSTWFQGVRLLPPASHLRYEIGTGRLVLSRYRNWPPNNRLNPTEIGSKNLSLFVNGRPPDLKRSSVVLADLLMESVQRRVGKKHKNTAESATEAKERIGVLLSGGISSRAVFAALPVDLEPIPTLTFGQPGCRDITLALRVSELRKTSHHIVIEITKDTWLEEREESVWCTDGQMPLQHMHGFESLSRLENHMDICLTGLMGTALLGGHYLGDTRWTFWEKYLHRGRRLIHASLHHGKSGLRFRTPLLDLKLIEALSQIPESQIKDGAVYRLLLLQHWPDFFQRVPWQKTNMPLGLNPKLEQLRLQSRNFGQAVLDSVGRKNSGDSTEACDYANWLRLEPGKEFVAATLFCEGSHVLDTWVDKKAVKQMWESHLAGQNHTEILGRYLTATLWLNRLKNLP